ncbi:MAG TPA: RNA methyltransferase [Miltoncostaeaceae bacterium]|nr:RNA methyltransferase [Miltoncostaeaceae bacterium]
MTGAGEVVYGRNPVRELLAAGRRPVREVWALPQLGGEPWLAAATVRSRDRAALARACGTGDHQGVVAFTGPYPYVPPRSVLEAGGPVACLDGAQDPRNLGAISRVADAAGAGGLVIAARGSPGVTAVVCKASAGAVEHLAIARAESIAGFLQEARDAGRQVVGADPEGGVAYTSAHVAADAVIVLGSEGAGLRPRVARACDVLVAIPMRGRVASLNISVAAGLLLFEAGRGLAGRAS